jgi:hypothetical protein
LVQFDTTMKHTRNYFVRIILLFLFSIDLLLYGHPVELTGAQVRTIAKSIGLQVLDTNSFIEIIHNQQTILPATYADFKREYSLSHPKAAPEIIDEQFLKAYEDSLKKAFKCNTLPISKKENCHNAVKIIIAIVKHHKALLYSDDTQNNNKIPTDSANR